MLLKDLKSIVLTAMENADEKSQKNIITYNSE
jgi:hypothetical protein